MQEHLVLSFCSPYPVQDIRISHFARLQLTSDRFMYTTGQMFSPSLATLCSLFVLSASRTLCLNNRKNSWSLGIPNVLGSNRRTLFSTVGNLRERRTSSSRRTHSPRMLAIRRRSSRRFQEKLNLLPCTWRTRILQHWA